MLILNKLFFKIFYIILAFLDRFLIFLIKFYSFNFVKIDIVCKNFHTQKQTFQSYCYLVYIVKLKMGKMIYSIHNHFAQ